MGVSAWLQPATMTLAASKAIADKWFNGFFIDVSERHELKFFSKPQQWDESAPGFTQG
jgi:hypothetical protein